MITTACPYCGSELIKIDYNTFSCSEKECIVGNQVVPSQYVKDLYMQKYMLIKAIKTLEAVADINPMCLGIDLKFCKYIADEIKNTCFNKEECF